MRSFGIVPNQGVEQLCESTLSNCCCGAIFPLSQSDLATRPLDLLHILQIVFPPLSISIYLLQHISRRSFPGIFTCWPNYIYQEDPSLVSEFWIFWTFWTHSRLLKMFCYFYQSQFTFTWWPNNICQEDHSLESGTFDLLNFLDTQQIVEIVLLVLSISIYLYMVPNYIYMFSKSKNPDLRESLESGTFDLLNWSVNC